MEHEARHVIDEASDPHKALRLLRDGLLARTFACAFVASLLGAKEHNRELSGGGGGGSGPAQRPPGPC